MAAPVFYYPVDHQFPTCLPIRNSLGLVMGWVNNSVPAIVRLLKGDHYVVYMGKKAIEHKLSVSLAHHQPTVE